MMKSTEVEELGGRKAALLENSCIRVLVSEQGGMVPEFSLQRGEGWIQAHWNPAFRGQGKSFGPEHAAYWKVKLLYDIAGNFLCFPNFGPDCSVAGFEFPPHGQAASGDWRILKTSAAEDEAVVELALAEGSGLKAERCPFEIYRKDSIKQDSPVHYSYIEVTNTTEVELPASLGWHNTVGAPFLESGCKISLAAQAFSTVPEGTEFDATTRLAFGAACDSLEAVPGARGETFDLSQVPGMIGYTDFITGSISASAGLGWSALYNPRLQVAYISLFKDQDSCVEHEIALRFNDLWMQYGGRHFTPWAPYDGGKDQTFCLGLENTTAYYANGLAEAVEAQELLGAPVVTRIKPGETCFSYYATALVDLSAYGNLFQDGIHAILPVENGVRLIGGYIEAGASGDAVRGEYVLPVDPDFIHRLKG